MSMGRSRTSPIRISMYLTVVFPATLHVSFFGRFPERIRPRCCAAIVKSLNSAVGTPSDSQDMAERAAKALLDTTASTAVQYSEKPLQKPKWHFGIRSQKGWRKYA